MVDLVQQIEEFIQDANLLSITIEKSNFMIDRLEGNPELQKHYLEQLKPEIDEYKQTIKALEFLFREYFVWEKKTKKTRNLRYRRLYKLVLKDLHNITQPTSK